MTNEEIDRWLEGLDHEGREAQVRQFYRTRWRLQEIAHDLDNRCICMPCRQFQHIRAKYA